VASLEPTDRQVVHIVGQRDLAQRLTARRFKAPVKPGQSSQLQPIEQPYHRPAVPSAAVRSGNLPLGQLVSDLLERQVAKFDQNRLQRLCIAVRFALVLLSRLQFFCERPYDWHHRLILAI
jgi:hypothetical protein